MASIVVRPDEGRSISLGGMGVVFRALKRISWSWRKQATPTAERSWLGSTA